MKINLSSRCRYRNFRLDSAKSGDYVIESYFAEPYILEVIYDNGGIHFQRIALVDINGNINIYKAKVMTYNSGSLCKILPKQHVHNLNKLILLS
jgi:hypothetical protein